MIKITTIQAIYITIIMQIMAYSAEAQTYPPKLDYRSNCREAAQDLKGIDQVVVFKACVATEMAAQRFVTVFWSRVPFEGQEKCLAEANGIAKYKFYQRTRWCLLREYRIA